MSCHVSRFYIYIKNMNCHHSFTIYKNAEFKYFNIYEHVYSGYQQNFFHYIINYATLVKLLNFLFYFSLLCYHIW